jgi:hypothetical protein
LPKLHTIGHPLATVQGGRQTGFKVRKNPTNSAFQALKTLLAYRLLPLSQPPQAGTIAEGTS